MKSLGIDIGSSSIKIVEVQASSKGYYVSRFIEQPLGVSPDHDQEIEILEFLRDLSSQYDHSQTRFVFSLSQSRVAMRNKFFPFNDRLKISRSLPFELEEDIPFSSENAIFDAKIIRYIGPGAEVLACAAPHVHVQNAIQRAKDSAMDPYLISCEGTAYANSYEDWMNPPPTVQAPSFEFEGMAPTRHLSINLHMGHSRTLVCVFEGKSLIHVSSISWGGKNIAQAIAAKYEIPYLEAMKELQTKAFILTNKQGATFDQVTFSETIASSVREMCRDLQLQILEIKSEFNAQIDSMGLTGGLSLVKNIAPFLTQVLEIPVNRVSPLDGVPHVSIDRSPVNGAKIGVALGLAFEAFKKPKNPPVNFQRGEFAKQNNQLQQFAEQWGTTAKYAGALLIALMIYSSVRNTVATNLVDQSQDILKSQAKAVAGLSGKRATESGIKKYILENKKRAADLKRLNSIVSMNSPLDITKKISEAIPPRNSLGMDIAKLSINDSKVQLSGYVKNQQELGMLQKSLANIALNGQVSSGNAAGIRALPGKTSFVLNFEVDRNVEKVTK